MRARVIALLLAVTALLAPGAARGQPPKAGVVTTVSGEATLARATLPRPVPVKFKDDVFARDRIDTRENAIVRVLLGGKALVTIREFSTFTVIEEAGRASVDLERGTLALAVARKLLRPGESVEIRTPNAVLGVRGSLVIADVRIIGNVPQTSFTALAATLPITVTSRADPRVSLTLNANQAVTVAGIGAAATAGPVQNLTPAQAREAARAAEAPKPRDQTERAPEPAARQMGAAKLQQAAQLAAFLAPPGREGAPPPPTPGAGPEGERRGRPEGPDPGLAPPPVLGGGPRPPVPIYIGPGAGGPVLFFIKPNEFRLSTGEFVKETADLPDLELVSTTLTLGSGENLRTFSGALTRSRTSPVVRLSGATVSGGQHLFAFASGASPTFSGPLLDMRSSSTVSITGDVVHAEVGTFTDTGTVALLQASGGSITANDLASISRTVNLKGILLSTSSSTGLDLSGKLVDVDSGGQLVVTDSTLALIGLSGGTHTLGTGATGRPMFSLAGRSTQTASEVADGVTLTLGTDQPLQHGGMLFEASGGSVTTGRGVQVDTALLSASAPLISLKGGNTFTSSLEALNLVQKAKVTHPGPVFKLDGSTLTVNSQHAITVATGSYLKVTGDLLKLSNGSTLKVLDGALLNVTGGSVVNISGALVNFNGSGSNQIRVTNSLCSGTCSTSGGIPILATNGGTVSISGAIKNSSLGSIVTVNSSGATVSNAAVIVVDGTNSKVTISGN